MKKTSYISRILGNCKSVLIAIILFFSISISLSCNGTSGPGEVFRSRPDNLPAGWEVSTFGERRIDNDRIPELLDLIEQGEYHNILSLVIIKDGYLLLDKYFNGYGYHDLQSCFSMTKSVSSALIGIALDKGYIDSVDIRMRDYFQEYQNIDWSEGKNRITLKNMLTMRSGLEWEELEIPYSSPLNSHTQMAGNEDWIEFVLRRPMEHAPSSTFEYNSGTSNMFAAIIREATGVPIDSFAQDNLFGPLGITDLYWNRDPLGNPCAGGSQGGVMLRPRDMARFGFLYLNHGVWNGVQVVPAAWVDQSTTRYVNVNFLGSSGYGYQWWITVFDFDGKHIEAPYAMGYGGQYIFVIEDLNMVVVFTGGGGGNEYAYTQVFEIMTDYILPAAGVAIPPP